jgi:hypothetical protein
MLPPQPSQGKSGAEKSRPTLNSVVRFVSFDYQPHKENKAYEAGGSLQKVPQRNELVESPQRSAACQARDFFWAPGRAEVPRCQRSVNSLSCVEFMPGRVERWRVNP